MDRLLGLAASALRLCGFNSHFFWWIRYSHPNLTERLRAIFKHYDTFSHKNIKRCLFLYRCNTLC